MWWGIGAVHLALLSTGEDRAKAVVDWTWAGFPDERSGRISVDLDEDEDHEGNREPVRAGVGPKAGA
jgi:hypothetical protein